MSQSHFLCVITILLFITLSINLSNSKDYRTIAKLKNKGIADWFTDEQKASIKQKRVRREVRDLSKQDWDKIASAMNTMKFTDGITGRVLYGEEYSSYDELVCYHSRTAWSYSGDFGHGIPHFGMWHRAFMLMFEKILLLVDSSIESFPYWDYRLDADDPKNSDFFSEAYIGNLMGDEKKEYAIANGPFAYWPMSDAEPLGCADISNVFGLMRERINPNPSLYVTRIGESLCNTEMNYVGDADSWDECLSIENFASFVSCYEIDVHTGAHSGVGGTTERIKKDSSTSSDDDDDISSHTGQMWCHNWLTNQYIEKNGYHIYRFYGHERTNCFVCPTCDLNDNLSQEEIEDCVCHPQSDCAMETDIGLTYSPSDDFNSEEDEHIWGDMLDGISSVNDPIFFFHHFNMDRYTYLWQLEFYDNKPYYGYPESGYEYGLNLYDIASPHEPLVGLFDQYHRDLQMTYQDIFDATSIEAAPYVYDDVYEAIFADESEYIDLMNQLLEEERERPDKNGAPIMNRHANNIVSSFKNLTNFNSSNTLLFVLIGGFVVSIAIFILMKTFNTRSSSDNKHYVENEDEDDEIDDDEHNSIDINSDDDTSPDFENYGTMLRV